MSLCKKGVARAKVRASNGKPSILYDALLKNYGSRDEALRLYAKANSANFSKLVENIEYEKDANGEPTIEFFQNLLNNNYDMKVKSKQDVTDNSEALDNSFTDVSYKASLGGIDPFESLADDMSNMSDEDYQKMLDADKRVTTNKADKAKGETTESFNKAVGNITMENNNPNVDFTLTPRKKEMIESSEALANHKTRLYIYNDVMDQIYNAVAEKHQSLKNSLTKLGKSDNPEVRKEIKETIEKINILDATQSYYASRRTGVEKIMTSENLVNEVIKQLDDINKQIHKDNVSSDTLMRFSKALDVWVNVTDTFILDNDSAEDIDLIRQVKAKADIVYQNFINKLNELNSKTVVALSSNPNVDDSYTIMKDIESRKDMNIFTAFTMAVSRNASTAIQIVHKLIDAGFKRMIYKVNKFNEIVEKAAKDIKDFEVFAEKYADGRATGMMVHYITPEFRDEEVMNNERINKKVKEKDQRFLQKLKFIKDNKLHLDARILFPDKVMSNGEKVYKGIATKGSNGNVTYTTEDLKKHQDAIIEALGGDAFAKEEFDLLKQRLEDKIDAFILELEVFDEARSEAVTEQEIYEFENRRNNFIARRSPYAASYMIEEVMNVIDVNNNHINSLIVADMPSVPRRYFKDINGNTDYNAPTNYYNESFKTISNSKAHLDFYRFYTNRMHQLNAMLPQHLKINASNDNYVALMDKSFIDLVNTPGVTFGEEFDKKLMDLYSRNQQSIVTTNKYTGKKEYRLGVEVLNASTAEIQRKVLLASAKLQEELNRELTIEERNEVRKDVVAELTTRKSFKLDDVLKLFNYQVENYMHKAAVEDSLRSINKLVDEAREVKKGKHGSVRLSKESSFLNLKKQLSYYTEVFYGYDKGGSVSDTKVYTEKEKEQLAEFDKLIGELHQNYNLSNGDMSEDEYLLRLAELEEARNEIGKYFSYDQILRSVLKYSQFKAMGYNYGAALTNTIQGFISNSIEAKDGRIFNKAQLFKAYGIMFGSITNFWTKGYVSTDVAEKVRNLARDYDLIGEVSSELEFKKFKKSSILNNVFIFQNSTEYLNQGPVIVATLMNTKVEIMKDGKQITTNLWDILDKNGIIRSDVELVDDHGWRIGESLNSGAKFIDTLTKVSQAISAVHGNYSKLTPTLMSSNGVLASMKQFKTWMFEAIAQRIEEEKYDESLHMTRKGRWRSGAGFVTWAKPKGEEHMRTNAKMIMDNTLFTLGQTLRSLVFLQSNYDERFSEVDAANIRKNVASAITTIRLFTLAMALGAILKNVDDDDEKDVVRYSINVSNRLIDDMQMYYSPTSLQNIARNIVPCASVITDAMNLIKGIYALMTGEVTATGVYAGEAEGPRYIMKALPIASKIHSTRAMSEQVMNTVR